MSEPRKIPRVPRITDPRRRDGLLKRLADARAHEDKGRADRINNLLLGLEPLAGGK